MKERRRFSFEKYAACDPHGFRRRSFSVAQAVRGEGAGARSEGFLEKLAWRNKASHVEKAQGIVAPKEALEAAPLP